MDLIKQRLSDVKIGQRFRFTKLGLIYIKDTEQGWNLQSSYCHTEKKLKTRGYGYEKERNTLRPQSSEIYEILPDIEPPKKSKRGGARPNSGPKLKYGEPTVLITFRCPVSLADLLKREINDYLDYYQYTSYSVIKTAKKV